MKNVVIIIFLLFFVLSVIKKTNNEKFELTSEDLTALDKMAEEANKSVSKINEENKILIVNITAGKIVEKKTKLQVAISNVKKQEDKIKSLKGDQLIAGEKELNNLKKIANESEEELKRAERVEQLLKEKIKEFGDDKEKTLSWYEKLYKSFL